MAVSYRHRRMAKRAGTKVIERHWYVITDPTHHPDLRGEFGGVKIKNQNGRKLVQLSRAQARFYMDQGVLQRLPADQQAQLNPAKVSARKNAAGLPIGTSPVRPNVGIDMQHRPPQGGPVQRSNR